MSKRKKILITAALPYANGPIHFGHIAGAYLPGDVYARFKRLMGHEVFYLSGSDEYGVAITLSAELAGRTPQQHVDHFHKVNLDLFKGLNISFDHFSRTTNRYHKPLVQKFFMDLLHNEHIEKKETEQLYSEEEGRFLADRYVMGECPKCHFKEARGDECPKCGASYDAMDIINPKSKLTKSPLKLKKTTHWFFRLDHFKEPLSHWIGTKDWKETVVNFARPYIQDLHSRPITRDFEWGVPVPLEEASDKVFYVWFDAVLGYISGTIDWAESMGQPEKWKEFWLDPDTRYVQFLGKDNISFHAVMFPAMIMGQNTSYKQVDDLSANEFLNLEGKQFSKSSGWYIDLADFLKRYPADTIRYTLAANAPETSDSEFTWNDFQMRVNSELVGKFGNFFHRTLSFLTNQMDGKIPECHSFDDTDNEFLEKINQVVLEIQEAYDHFRVRKASTLIMEMAALSNAYFDHKKPWSLIKDKRNQHALETTLYCCLTACKFLALTAFPIMPETSEKIWKMLGFTTSLEGVRWHVVIENELEPGVVVSHPTLLFAKIEDQEIAQEKAKLETTISPQKAPTTKEEIRYEDFAKVDLCVGSIEAAEKVEKSKRLLKLRVNLGSEKRTIVSGIAEHHPEPEALIGRKVIVVTNLKPATLMGIESQGMILAASDGKFLELPFLEEAPIGTRVS